MTEQLLASQEGLGSMELITREVDQWIGEDVEGSGGGRL
jgi:hypothetical protein